MLPERQRIHMFVHLLGRSLRGQRTELLLATGAVLLAAALIATMLAVPAGAQAQLKHEARAYGPNLLITAEGLDSDRERTMDQAALAKLDAVAGAKLEVASTLYGLVKVRAEARTLTQAVLAGMPLERTMALKPWWTLSGRLPQKGNETVLGADAAAELGLAVGDALNIATEPEVVSFRVVGVVTTGDLEDDHLFVRLETAQRILGKPGRISLAAVRAPVGEGSVPLSRLASALERALPEGQVEARETQARTEAELLRKVRLLLVLIAAISMAAALCCVMSALVAGVLKREAEIGLMKALGAENGQVAAFFVAEALLIGLAGGLGGFVLGASLTQITGLLVFQTGLPYGLFSLPAALIAGLGIVLVAVWGPIRHIVRLEPIRTLEVS